MNSEFHAAKAHGKMRVEFACPDEGGSQRTMRARRAHDLTIVKSSRLLNWEVICSGLSRTRAAIAHRANALAPTVNAQQLKYSQVESS
jgi:hypothetical protein